MAGESGSALRKHVVVIGGGVTGCVLAERLRQRRPDDAVTLLEGSKTLGGLSVASAPDELGWDRFYHVVTPQDVLLEDFLRRIGCADRLRFRSVHTGFFVDGKLFPFDSPLDFLRFSPLSFLEKTRLLAGIFYAVRLPVHKEARLWDVSAKTWLSEVFGDAVVEKFWAPLLRAKLGEAANETAAMFIASTIRRLFATRQGKDQKEAFGYISGGYKTVFEAAERYLAGLSVTVRKEAPVQHLAQGTDGRLCVRVGGENGHTLVADEVFFTGPCRALPALCEGSLLPPALRKLASTVRYLGVLCFAIKLLRPLLPYYVLNLIDSTLPFMGVIGLSTLVDPSELSGQHLVYLPRYLPDDHPDFDLPDDVLVPRFLSGISRVAHRRGFCVDEIVHAQLFRARFVSPIPVCGYDKLRLPVTLVPGRLHLVNSGRILGGTLNNNQMIEETERALDEVFDRAV